MQPTLIKALLSASLAFVPGMAAARHIDTNASAITVNAGATSLEQWNARVAQSLDANLTYPKAIGRSDFPEGAVRVAFRCSENGSPDGVSIVQSSHSNMLDQTALNAVKRISTLHPLPDGIGHDRSMEAWVFFASDQGAIDKMKKGFARQLQLAANASRPQGQQTASLPPLVIASR
jgi:TonB family protein